MARNDLQARRAKLEQKRDLTLEQRNSAVREIDEQMRLVDRELRELERIDEEQRGNLIGALIMRTKASNAKRYADLVAELTPTLRKREDRELFGLVALPGSPTDEEPPIDGGVRTPTKPKRTRAAGRAGGAAGTHVQA